MFSFPESSIYFLRRFMGSTGSNDRESSLAFRVFVRWLKILHDLAIDPGFST